METKIDRERRFAVGVSLIRTESGKLRLVLEDLQAAATTDVWEHRCLFTYLDIDEKEAREYALDKTTYASIGDALVARLLALEDTP